MTDRYWLDPREVWTVTGPDGKLVAYVWEPERTPVPLPTAPAEPACGQVVVDRGGHMTGNIKFCFGPGTDAPAEVTEDSGISREQWEVMSEAEQDAAVQGWMPARSGVVWVAET